MREIELWNWYLPPPPGSGPRVKPHLSRWKMTAEEAARRGAIRPEPTSREVRQVPEEGERDINGSFSHLGTSWKK